MFPFPLPLFPLPLPLFLMDVTFPLASKKISREPTKNNLTEYSQLVTTTRKDCHLLCPSQKKKFKRAHEKEFDEMVSISDYYAKRLKAITAVPGSFSNLHLPPSIKPCFSDSDKDQVFTFTAERTPSAAGDYHYRNAKTVQKSQASHRLPPCQNGAKIQALQRETPKFYIFTFLGFNPFTCHIYSIVYVNPFVCHIYPIVYVHVPCLLSFFNIRNCMVLAF